MKLSDFSFDLFNRGRWELILSVLLVVVSTALADPDTQVNRYATAEDADFWPSVNEGDYIFFQGNSDSGAAIYAPADLYGNTSQLSIELYVGQKILIYAGNYKRVLINSVNCSNTVDSPTVVTRLGGQVRWGNNEDSAHYRTFEFLGFEHLHFTGKYDPGAQTGDVEYLGHNGGEDFDSGDYYERYGLWGDPGWSGPRFADSYDNGVRISRFETLKVDYVASWGGYFASFNIKTDNPEVPGEMEVDIQDCFAGFGENEGFYISYSTSAEGQDLTKLTLKNNIVAFAGSECLQTDNLSEGSVIENNVCIGSALFFRRPFQAQFQDSMHQLSFVEGDVRVQNNIFVGTNGALYNVRYKDPGEGRGEPSVEKPVRISNNYYGFSRTQVGYMWQGDGVVPYEFVGNVYGDISVPIADQVLHSFVERAATNGSLSPKPVPFVSHTAVIASSVTAK